MEALTVDSLGLLSVLWFSVWFCVFIINRDIVQIEKKCFVLFK